MTTQAQFAKRIVEVFSKAAQQADRKNKAQQITHKDFKGLTVFMGATMTIPVEPRHDPALLGTQALLCLFTLWSVECGLMEPDVPKSALGPHNERLFTEIGNAFKTPNADVQETADKILRASIAYAP